MWAITSVVGKDRYLHSPTRLNACRLSYESKGDRRVAHALLKMPKWHVRSKRSINRRNRNRILVASMLENGLANLRGKVTWQPPMEQISKKRPRNQKNA